MNPSLEHRHVERFRAVVADRLGLAFEESRLGLLAEALRRRVDSHGGDGESYLRRLALEDASGAELRQIARELTVTETYFYRGSEQIQAFLEVALPRRLAACGGLRKLRVLSAGCASGEEPYSLAMAIREQAPEAAERVSITACDVNPAMLEKAGRGHYTSWSLRELPDEMRARWFRPESGGYALDPSLRQSVAIEGRNLAEDRADLWSPQSWDIVFCRNVLMYFDPERARGAVARIARSLAPGGYLFLGHAETLRGLSNDFHLCHSHDAFYYRVRDGASEPELPERVACMPAAPSSVDDETPWAEAVQQAAERIDALALAARGQAQATVSPAAHAKPDLTRALELLRHERYGQALSQLSVLPAEQAREPDALLLRAVSAAYSGALPQAESACRELLALDELNAGAHYVLALCREALGDADGALEQNRIALYLDPGFAMARLRVGLLAHRRGEREAARRELTHAASALLQEDASRLLLFGGGFARGALVAICRAELARCEAAG